MIMNSIKKYLALGVIATSLLALNPIGASAEWKQDSKGYWYAEGNSYARHEWKFIGGKSYYFDSDGYMQTGWLADIKYNTGGDFGIIDETYYYLNSDGALDNSKTTKTLPSEVKKAYDIVANFEKEFKNDLHFDWSINSNYDEYKQFGASFNGGYFFETGNSEATYDSIAYDAVCGKILIYNQGRGILFDSNKVYDSIEEKAKVIDQIRNWQNKLPNNWETFLNIKEDKNTYRIEKYNRKNNEPMQYDCSYSYSKENGEITKN